ncbi:hypothetical protein BDV93DRAFT_527350 [Ceratobasidium sp. AG-I]|nr:hypothetical protein BDV93DRAFT_527350 [Ceratobasidium sp. AG-I]
MARTISITGAFLYPTYASYKTLSRRPTSEAELERWLMYWSVMGCVTGIEMVAEWMIRWIPLYWYLKTIFLLYLALPQTQGATKLYTARLQPVLKHYEPQIDASVARLRSRAYVFMREKLNELWARVVNAQQQPGAQAAPPNMQDPMSAPIQMASGLWRAYSPMILGAAAGAMMQPPAPAVITPARSRSSSSSSTSSFAPTDINLTSRAKPAIETRSSAGVRSRGAPRVATPQGGEFEEIDPSDVPAESPSSANGWLGGWASKTPSAYDKIKAD